MGSGSISLSVQRYLSPRPLQLCFQQEDPWGRAGLLSWKLPTQLLPVWAAPHGFLCSCALGKALINARRRTPTATSGFFLAAEAKSQVLWPGARRSAQGHSPTEDFLCPTRPSGQRPKSLVWGARPHVWHPVGCGIMVNSICGPPNSVFVWEHKARSTFEGR